MEQPPTLQNYSFPGVLHYLQVEWRKFERERNEWEIERADLKVVEHNKARVAFLEGERKALENLKNDLIRRVKMLEYTIRQERYLKMTRSKTTDTIERKPSIETIATDAVVENYRKGFGHSKSREMLKKYLTLISYLKEAENLLAVTVTKPKVQVDDSIEFDGREVTHRRSVQNIKDEDRNMTLKPLSNLPGNFESIKTHSLKSDKKKKSLKRIKSPISPMSPSIPESVTKIETGRLSPSNFILLADTTVSIAEVPVADTPTQEAYATFSSDQIVPTSTWVAQPPLQNHYDSIRSVQFHPTDLALFTGSEDHTAKLWRITFDPSIEESKLVYTFRGHTAPLTSVTVSPTDDYLFTASMDSTIRIWNIPPLSTPNFAANDPSIAITTLVGHSDAVWDIQPHRVASLLISASADGSMKLWDVQNPGLKSTYWYGGATKSTSADESPTSVCWVNSNQFVTSFKNSIIKLFDMESRAALHQFESNQSYGIEI